jgi:hypothetical protein
MERHKTILLRGRWWLPPSPSHNEFCESELHTHYEAHIQVCSTNLANFNVGNVQVVKILGVVGGPYQKSARQLKNYIKIKEA